jgi:hypothetical protein
MTNEGVQRGGREKITSSGNRGGEDVFKETRALWQLPTTLTTSVPKRQGSKMLGNYAACDNEWFTPVDTGVFSFRHSRRRHDLLAALLTNLSRVRRAIPVGPFDR